MSHGRPSAAATFTVAVVLVSAIGASLAQAAVHAQDRRSSDARIDTDRARLEMGLDLVRVRVSRLAAHAAAGDVDDAFQAAARAVVDDVVVDAVLLTDPDRLTVRSLVAGRPLEPLGEQFDLDTVEGLALAAETSVSTGRARVVAPASTKTGPAVLAVAPVVPTGTPADVTGRRAATDHFVVGAVSLQQLLRPAGAPELWPGGEPQITTPTGVVGAAPAGRVEHRTVDAGGVVWQVAVGPLDGPRRLLGWYVLTAGLAVALAVHRTMRRQQERQKRAERDAGDKARQLELIAGTSASLHQSLELAEMLPSFCVRMVSEFDLSSVSILLADDTGELLEAFRYGDAWPSDVTADFDLRHGVASVGRLVVRSRHPIDEVSGRSVQALSDLLAVAVSNAHLLLREQQAVARFRELDALKNAFLGTVSHELRTSTTAVQGFGELLTEHWDTLPEERRRELASRIKRQAGSLRHLVDDLLDYARLEHQRLRVMPRDVSLSELVHQLTDSMSPLVADHEVVLRVEADVMAWVDPVAVERILANLLSNAGKYAPPGTVVTVTVGPHEGRARLSVADQGPGIPAEERRRVFVRFYRLSNAETIRTRGAGIGLSILHDFAEHSHAEVAIEDAPGGGALIVVDFPTTPVVTDAPALAGP